MFKQKKKKQLAYNEKLYLVIFNKRNIMFVPLKKLKTFSACLMGYNKN